MKKIIFCFVCICVLLQMLGGCVLVPKNQVKEQPETTRQNAQPADGSQAFVRSVWIAYYELGEWTNAAKDAQAFQNSMTEIFEKVKAFGFNTVTVQVRPCADAFYDSAYFPVSHYCFKDGKLRFDPLSVLCSVADTTGLRIEAWINPYRISQNTDSYPVPQQFADMAYSVGKGAYLNPANSEVQALIAKGAAEIAKNYSIDAIHFDDYFYPTAEKEIDAKEYAAYQESGGELALDDWRRQTVTSMVEAVQKAVSQANASVQFGISPSGNIEYCRDSIYADVESWAAGDILDYICPQLYYGFLNESLPYEQTLQHWCEITEKPALYVGLPLYKSGKEDDYASADNDKAISEFQDNTDVIVRQAKAAAASKNVRGIYIFSYSSVFAPENEQQKKEAENLRQYFAQANAAG